MNCTVENRKRLILNKRINRVESYDKLIDFYKNRGNLVEVNRCLKERYVLYKGVITLKNALKCV